MNLFYSILTERPKQPITGPKEYYKAPFLDPYTESPSFPQKEVKPAPGDYERTPSDEKFHEGDVAPGTFFSFLALVLVFNIAADTQTCSSSLWFSMPLSAHPSPVCFWCVYLYTFYIVCLYIFFSCIVFYMFSHVCFL